MKTPEKLLEEWRTVMGYEGFYEISSLGRCRSVERKIFREDGVLVRTVRSKILKQCGRLYQTVGLSVNDNKRTWGIHKLVAMAFIPNTENKPIANHIDGNKWNNCVYNLEWSTYSENAKHAFKIGLSKPTWLGKKLSQKHKDNISKSKRR